VVSVMVLIAAILDIVANLVVDVAHASPNHV